MSAVVLPQPERAHSRSDGNIRFIVVLALVAWLLIALSLGAAGAFVGAPRKPPMAIAIGGATPLILFFAWLRFSQAFRAFVLSMDLRLVAGMQAWRWAGIGFLDLYAHSLLPGVFAFPAGLGDMAIGVTAPWIALALARRPDFAARKAFVRWNLLGILDLVVAVTVAAVSTVLATGAAGEVSVAPMARLPLVVVPAFFVPFFLILHAVALLQSRQARIGTGTVAASAENR